MAGIKIPVSAELNQQDIQAQIKQLESSLNELGAVAQNAGKIRFTPVTKATVDDVKRIRAEFDAMVRMAPGLKRALEAGGQGGKKFDTVDWSKVWSDPNQRAGHAATMLKRFTPGSTDILPPPNDKGPTPMPSGGGGSRRPRRGPAGEEGEDEIPPSAGGKWKRAAAGGAAGVAGGVASQLGGLGGGVASGALSGGLVGGPLGAAVGGLAGAITSLLGSIGEARDVAISLDTLKRALGDTGVSFSKLQDTTHGLADEFSLTDTDAVDLTSRYARLSGSDKNVGGLRDEIGVGVGFSRSFGMDPSAGVDFFGQMKGLGITKSADDNKRLALMIGESVAKAGELPRIGDVMAGLSRYLENGTTRTLSAGNSDAWLAKMAGLSQTGLPGTSPGASANMIAKADSAVSQGGITEAGKNFMSGQIQKELGLNAIQAGMQLEGGLFGTGKGTFGPGTAMGTYYEKNGIQPPAAASSTKTNMEILMGSLESQYKDRPDLMLDAMKTQFGLSYGQAAAWQSSGSAKVGGLVSRLSRLGVDPSQVNATGISKLSQIEANDKLTDAQKDTAAKDAASKNQEDTIGSEARRASIDGGNAMVRLAAEGLPMISSIQAGVLKLAGIDPLGPQKALLAEQHKKRSDAIDAKEGKVRDAAVEEYQKITPWAKRLSGMGLSDEQQFAKDRVDAANDDLITARKAEDSRYGRAVKDVEAGVKPTRSTGGGGGGATGSWGDTPGTPELRPVIRDKGPDGTGSTSSGPVRARGESLSDYLKANPDMAARLEKEDDALGHEKGTAAAQLWQESRFKKGAVSNQGALGYAQMMPENVAALSKRVGRDLDPGNFEDSLLMRRMLMQDNQNDPNIGHNLDRELMAYYGGASGKAWGPKTRQYPADVKRWMEKPANADQMPLADGGEDADRVPAIEMRKREQEAVRREQTMNVHVHQSGEFILRDTSGNQVAQADIQTTVAPPRASGAL